MKKILVSLFTLILIISMITTVYAATGNINLGASSDTVEKGKTFTVTLAGTADNNITGLQAALSFDSNKLAIESKAAGANFTDASGSNSEIAILSSGSTVSKSGTLYTITFKVLDNAAEGDTKISVTNATLALVNDNQEQENVKVVDETVTVKIKGNTSAGDNNNENKGNTAGSQQGNNTKAPSNTSNSGNKSTTSKSNSTATKKNTKLPQTGIETMSILVIISLGIISIISYVSYKRYKNI